VSNEHRFFALTNAVEGREADFHAWYDTYHLKEVIANCPGFVAGRRFELESSGGDLGRPSPWRYIAMYEVQGEDLPAIHQAVVDFIKERGFTGHGGSLDRTHAAWVYTPASPKATGGTSTGNGEHLLLVLTNPAEGRHDDLDRWYEEQGVGAVVSLVPGVVSGRRYVADPANQRPGESPPWQSMALYELEGDAGELPPRGKLMPPEDTVEPDVGVWVYRPIGDRVTRAEVESTAVAGQSR
jgi:hypothetical protein